ncbi:TIGR02300 family protein [Breoghania sp. L-A4]|uniref:TIGR02300 family protein n=1 Tax=Breoghania sp. L-A4 TaxID=2304600 RepID=UPI000E36047D|nr:TIGR02300 family protein [Breoghania sp. L-A4]AXS39064.1 TIGR02300 family protein [Breoghania sp. L-A4]
MTKPDLGTKHLCPGCGTKFYDLKRTPITCPKCGTVVSLAVAKGSGGRAAKAAAAVEPEATEDLVVAKEENVEIVSLEDADAEQISSKKSVIDDDDDVDDVEDVDDIDDDAADDDTFLEDDEDDDAVPDIVVVRETDEDL